MREIGRIFATCLSGNVSGLQGVLGFPSARQHNCAFDSDGFRSKARDINMSSYAPSHHEKTQRFVDQIKNLLHNRSLCQILSRRDASWRRNSARGVAGHTRHEDHKKRFVHAKRYSPAVQARDSIQSRPISYRPNLAWGTATRNVFALIPALALCRFVSWRVLVDNRRL